MATSSQDGASGSGPHAQTEAVGLGPAAVVRLKRALAHEVFSVTAQPCVDLC